MKAFDLIESCDECMFKTYPDCMEYGCRHYKVKEQMKNDH